MQEIISNTSHFQSVRRCTNTTSRRGMPGSHGGELASGRVLERAAIRLTGAACAQNFLVSQKMICRDSINQKKIACQAFTRSGRRFFFPRYETNERSEFLAGDERDTSPCME